MANRNNLARWSVISLMFGALAWGAGGFYGQWAAAQAETDSRGAAEQLADTSLKQLETQLSSALTVLHRHSADPAAIRAIQQFDRNGDYHAQLRLNQAFGKLAAEMPWAGRIDFRDRTGNVVASSEVSRIGSPEEPVSTELSPDILPSALLRYHNKQLTLRIPWQQGRTNLGHLDYSFASTALAKLLPDAQLAATTALRTQLSLDSESGTNRLVRRKTGSAANWEAGELSAVMHSQHFPLRVEVAVPRQAAQQILLRHQALGNLAGMIALALALLLMTLHALWPYLHGIRLLRHMRTETSNEIVADDAAPAVGADGHSQSERMAYDILATHHVLEEVLKEHTGELEKLYRVLNQEHRRRDQAESALKAAEARFHEAVESSLDGVWEWNDKEGLRTWISESFLVIQGLRRSEFPGTLADFLAAMHPDDANASAAAFQQQVRFGSRFEIEYRLRNRKGDWNWYATRGQVIRDDASQKVIRLTGCVQDIQARKRAELEVERLLVELERRAHRDELTGLHNRPSFLEQANSELKRADRTTLPTSLMMLDLDFFKRVNDRHGHAAGDQVLVRFAEELREVLRESDVCARVGGEEFLVLLPETSLLQARKLAERVRTAIAAQSMPITGGESISITCSIGVTRHLPGETLEACMLRADEMLYRAKNQGRDRVCAEMESVQPLKRLHG